MNRNDIIRMAHEAGLHIATDHDWMPIIALAYAQKFAELVAAAEREACADIAENWRCNGMPRYGVAEAIRARGDALAKLNQAAEDNGEPL